MDSGTDRFEETHNQRGGRAHTDDNLDIDIFRDLDTGFIEIFRRNQYERFLRGVPPDQQEEQLNMLNQAVRHHRNHHDYIQLLWVWGFFPLPIIKYKRLWHDINFAQLFSQLAMTIFNAATRIFRFTMFLIGSSFYLQRTIRVLFMFGHELTFSKNFFGDILTFILRDHAGIFDRRSVIENKGIKYLIALTYNYNEVPFWEYFTGVIYNSLVLQVNSKCVEQQKNQFVCTPNTSTLIFKFDSVFRHNFPNINPDILVVVTYLAYAMIGNFICMNIFYLYSINIFNKIFKFNSFTSGFASLIWNGTAGSVM